MQLQGFTKKETVLHGFSWPRVFIHLITLFFNKWIFLKVVFFLLLSFIRVGVSYFLEKLWRQSLELSRGVKKKKKITHVDFIASQHLPWIGGFFTFYEWRNWGPVRLSHPASNSIICVLGKFKNQKGMGLTFMVGIVLISQGFSLI